MATGAQDVTDREGEEEIFQVSEQQRQPGVMGGGGWFLGKGGSQWDYWEGRQRRAPAGHQVREKAAD